MSQDFPNATTEQVELTDRFLSELELLIVNAVRDIVRAKGPSTVKDMETDGVRWIAEWWHEKLLSQAKDEALQEAADEIDLSEFYDPSPSGGVSTSCHQAENAARQWLRNSRTGQQEGQ